ncbi:MAG: hypothetical protein EBT96_07670 [Betaproteobacteria bacterium]|nr:hypothetical protein [Betaproteobacteria bacterium]
MAMEIESRGLAPMQANDTARTIGLIGSKGGVGTTLLASSLAWALAERGLRVVLLDLDTHGGQAALHLCERNAGPTLRDVLQVIDRLDDTLLDTLLTPCSQRLRLLPAPRQWLGPAVEAAPEPQHLLRLVHTAATLADCVVLDLPARAAVEKAYAAVLVDLDRLELISEPSLPATFNARRSWHWLQTLRAEGHEGRDAACHVVLNQVHRHQALDSAQVWRTLGLEDRGAAFGRELPRSDEAVAQAIYQGQALGALQPRDALSRAVARWAEEVEGAFKPKPAAAAHADSRALAQATPSAGWRERLIRWAT